MTDWYIFVGGNTRGFRTSRKFRLKTREWYARRLYEFKTLHALANRSDTRDFLSTQGLHHEVCQLRQSIGRIIIKIYMRFAFDNE